MKILHARQGPIELHRGNYYGVSAHLKRYIRHCDEIIYLCNITETEQPKMELIDVDNVRYVDMHKINSLKGMLCDESKNKKIIEGLIDEVDACIVHLPSRLGDQVVKVAKQRNKPYMAVIVGCAWDGLWNYDLRGKLMAPLSFYSTRKAIKDSPYALYVTQKFLQKRYPTNGISAGCSDVKLLPQSNVILDHKVNGYKALANQNRSIRLATSAAVDVPYKGQEYVIRAMAQLKCEGLDFEYHLLGGGDQTYLRDCAKKYGLEDRVIFHGFLSHSEVFTILDNTDLYVQPSKQEGLPRALVEAMSRACPAIASKIAGIPELLPSDCLFPKGDVTAIIKLLRSFTPQKMEADARRNFEKAKEYEYSSLEARRDGFIAEFIKSVEI